VFPFSVTVAKSGEAGPSDREVALAPSFEVAGVGGDAAAASLGSIDSETTSAIFVAARVLKKSRRIIVASRLAQRFV
jgi:hypothetical protein